MRISISNIAWSPEYDGEVAQLLSEFGADAIDVAPGKYFDSIPDATNDGITRVRATWADRGVEIVGMQSLLFGTEGLNVFGDAATQERMLAYLQQVCRVGGGLGARYLVFGSPRNRDRSGLEDAEVSGLACDFFRRLGDFAIQYDTVICLEPNPVQYGANFMTDAASTAEIVRATNHPAIRMQLDVGALTLNCEDPEMVLADCAELVAHIHASEPGLKVLGDHGAEHAGVAAAIRKHCPDRVVTIEMLDDGEATLPNIERALAYASRCYGDAELV